MFLGIGQKKNIHSFAPDCFWGIFDIQDFSGAIWHAHLMII